MDYVALENTGLQVSRLGIGLAEIGETDVEVSQVDRLLNAALDAGINFLDTAACYGHSEELIGRTVAGRRVEFSLATKCGHVAGGYEGQAWSAQTIADSIDRSLARLQTDHVDLVQLHSCDLATLERGEVVEALLRAKQQGKTRLIGYSGDNAAARWAVASGHFETLQTSFSLVDQKARRDLFDAAEAAGLGIIVKRPIANGVWGRDRSPSSYAHTYFKRARAMAAAGPITAAPDDPVALALGFALAHPAVDTAIVGTLNPDHLGRNVEMLAAGLSLPDEAIAALNRRFDNLGRKWPQLI